MEKNHSDFQFFTYEEFLINPTKHIFGEKYIKMSEKEFIELFGPSTNLDPKDENIMKYLKDILEYPELNLSDREIKGIISNKLTISEIEDILQRDNIVKLIKKQIITTKTNYSDYFSDGIRKGKFPKIDLNKPLSKWYDWKNGDVIKIIRENKIYPSTIPITVSYRVVK